MEKIVAPLGPRPHPVYDPEGGLIHVEDILCKTNFRILTHGASSSRAKYSVYQFRPLAG
jgi:hypothetical protein